VKRLELRLHVDMATESNMTKLAEIAKRYAGATPLAVALLMPGEAETLIGNTNLKVQVTDELLESVNRLFGARVAEPG
jgi:DNA polymerase III subunit alpha